MGTATLVVSGSGGGTFHLVVRADQVITAGPLVQRSWTDPKAGAGLTFYQDVRDSRRTWTTNELHPVVIEVNGHTLASARGECRVTWSRPAGGGVGGSLSCKGLRGARGKRDATATFRSAR